SPKATGSRPSENSTGVMGLRFRGRCTPGRIPRAAAAARKRFTTSAAKSSSSGDVSRESSDTLHSPQFHIETRTSKQFRHIIGNRGSDKDLSRWGNELSQTISTFNIQLSKHVVQN